MENHTPLQPKPKQNAEGSMGENSSMEGLSSDKSAIFSAGRPEIVARKKLQDGINNSPQVQQFRAMQQAANNSPQVKAAAQLQRIATAANAAAVQRKQREMEQGGGADSAQLKDKNTGLPSQLKAGIEQMSGMSMDNVKVHYNSSEPAQLQAHAFAQGENIHVAPGQEKHLGHEAWHVVQQKQGRVQPTTQMKGTVPINDDAGLEREADIKGAEAAIVGGEVLQNKTFTSSLSNPSAPAQRKVAQLVSGTKKIENIQNLKDPADEYPAIVAQINQKLPSIAEVDRERIGQKVGDTSEGLLENTKEFKKRMVKEANKLLEALNNYEGKRASTISQVEAWLTEEAGTNERNIQILAKFKALTPELKTKTFKAMNQKAYYDDFSKWKTFLSPDFNDLILGMRKATQEGASAAVKADAGEMNREGIVKAIIDTPGKISTSVGKLDAGKDANGKSQNLSKTTPELGALSGVAGVGTGAFGIYEAVDKLKDKNANAWTKTEAAAKGVNSGGAMVSGSWTFASSMDKIINQGKNSVAQSGIAGAVSGGLTAVTGTISLIKSSKEFISKDGKTKAEMLQGGLELGSQAAALGKSGADLGTSILKAAGTTTGATVAALGTASGALAVITGSIDMVVGGVQILRAALSTRDINKGEKAQAAITQGLTDTLTDVQAQLKIIPLDDEEARKPILEKLEQLEKVLKQLKAIDEQFGPAMKAMKMLNGRKMERAALKVVSGGLAVAGGIIALTGGVGAPVGVALAAIGGLITLGTLAVNFRRNEAANRLTQIAGLLTDDGNVAQQSAAEAPGYRTMEKRIFKYYYSHLDEVIDRKAPTDMTEDEFTDIQRFTWMEKKDRVKSEKVTTLKPGQSANSLGDSEKRDTWVKKETGKNKFKSEKPDNWSWENVKLMTSASAHKSKQAEKASKEDITDAVYRLGQSSWNDEKSEFVPAPVIITDIPEGGEKEAQEYAHVTLRALLDAASITPKKWKKWKAKAEKKDEAAKALEAKKALEDAKKDQEAAKDPEEKKDAGEKKVEMSVFETEMRASISGQL
jgi:Domain of unknown function (DUF4157)